MRGLDWPGAGATGETRLDGERGFLIEPMDREIDCIDCVVVE